MTARDEYINQHLEDFDCGCGRCDLQEMRKHAEAVWDAATAAERERSSRDHWLKIAAEVARALRGSAR